MSSSRRRGIFTLLHAIVMVTGVSRMEARITFGSFRRVLPMKHEQLVETIPPIAHLHA